MKSIKNMLFLGAFIFSLNCFAQVEDVKKVNAEAAEMNNQARAIDDNIKTTQNTVNNLKDTFGSIFGSGKNKKETVIAFTGLEFGDENLSLVFNELKAMKGVKDVSTKIDQGTVQMVIKSKKGVFELWENFSPQVKEIFAVVQADNTSMLVQVKKTSTGTVTQVSEAENNDQ